MRRAPSTELRLSDNYPKTVLTLDRLTIGNYDGIRVENAMDWLLKKINTEQSKPAGDIKILGWFWKKLSVFAPIIKFFTSLFAPFCMFLGELFAPFSRFFG